MMEVDADSEIITSEIERVIDRADSAPGRKRGGRRDKEGRERKGRIRNQDQKENRDEKRKKSVAIPIED